MIKLSTALVTLALLLFLAGCNIGPNYVKPKVPAAPAYSEAPPAQFTESPGWKTANRPMQPSEAIGGNCLAIRN